LRSPIKDIAPNLPDEYFKRVHKSFIVNINKIDALTSKELKIKEEIIPIGRNYYADLQKIIYKLNENDT
jgi:DNA-binding LytR/AlgR family response regulator